MYKSITSYSGHEDGVLQFNTGTLFNLIEQIDEHWWFMINEAGCCGLVPASYLQVNKAGQKEVIESIDRSLEAMQNLLVRQGNVFKESDKRNIQKLLKKRKAISEEPTLWGNGGLSSSSLTKRQAPKVPPGVPSRTSSFGSQSSISNGTPKHGKSTKRYSAPLPPTDKLPFDGSKLKLDTSLDEVESSISKGASSKIYNLHVSQGNISPLDKKSLDQRSDISSKNSSSQNSPVYLVSPVCEGERKINRDINTTEPLTEIIGEKLKITKLENGNNNSSIKNSASEHRDKLIDNSDICNNARVQSQPTIPDELGKDLIDQVRARCKISFNKSLAAVRCVLYNLGKELPEISVAMETIQKQICDDNLNIHRGLLSSEDEDKLRKILDELTTHKEDSQQRSWALHEDFLVIKELLDQLITVMNEIDPSICRSVLQEDEYKYINDLIVYYQMEARSKLRISLLHVFGCFCQLGNEFISQLLCSVLPTELAQDLMQDNTDITKFLSTSLMLTMIFSSGEPVPYHHYVQLNESFVEFLLDNIEDPPDSDRNDQASDALIATLLAFNQHFKAWTHNTIMQVISKRQSFRTLSEKVLLLLNREEDPVVMFDFQNPCPDSVVKFLMDLFASKETCGVFYTNDLYVLIEIILRQITDRQPKDKVRTEYLSLFHSLLNTSNYDEHRHHLQDFKRSFQDILFNKEFESEVDIYIVKEITNRFPHLFS